jgi:hypothetical protein
MLLGLTKKNLELDFFSLSILSAVQQIIVKNCAQFCNPIKIIQFSSFAQPQSKCLLLFFSLSHSVREQMVTLVFFSTVLQRWFSIASA